VTFTLALHPKSPSPIFYLKSDDDEYQDLNFLSDEDDESEEEPHPATHWRRKEFHLRPGEEYGESLQPGQFFLFASVLEKRSKGKTKNTSLAQI
jgi:hypothetical protein